MVHPAGTLLWDTGLGDDLAGTAGRTIPDVAVFRVERTLREQLTGIGHPPETVDHLALSHFHPDHVGNVALFEKARLLVQREDHAAAFGDTPDAHGFEPGAYTTLREQETTLLDDSGGQTFTTRGPACRRSTSFSMRMTVSSGTS